MKLWLFLMLGVWGTEASTEHLSKTVISGSAVDLHCEAPEGTDMENMALEWTRSDLDQQSYVFLFRDGRPFLVYQNDRFKRRVNLKDPKLSSRDVSIRLDRVVPQDSGQYECHVFSQSHIRKRSTYNTKPIRTIDLTVTEPKAIHAEPGDDVSFLVEKPGFNVMSVIWKRKGDPDNYVFLFGMGHPHHQHPQYDGRTELQTKPQNKTGTEDMSIILRNVQPSDSGTYHCYIIQAQQRSKRDLHQSTPYAVIDLHVPEKMRTSAAIRLEAGAVMVATVLVSLCLQQG